MTKNKKQTPAPRLFTVKKTGWNEVYPFTQQPSSNQFPGSAIKTNGPEVSELFSRFTADIIREDVRFTR